MKTLKLLVVLFLVIGILSCKKDNIEDDNRKVENYIQLLKSGKYTSSDLPAFTDNDIPALLKYRNETQLIANFPHNPISSSYHHDWKLGMYVLWPIESIRAVAINSKYLIMRFPSQNPVLALKSLDELKLIDNTVSHKIAARHILIGGKATNRKILAFLILLIH